MRAERERSRGREGGGWERIGAMVERVGAEREWGQG